MAEPKNFNSPEKISALFAEIETNRGYLIRFATAKLRDAVQAEEVWQEAVL